jgi:hypothetical protein
LSCNIVLDSFSTNITCCGNKIARSPKGRESQQLREFFSEVVRCPTLNAFHDEGGTVNRLSAQKQVNVVAHDFQSNNAPSVLITDFTNNFLETFGYSANKNLLPTFRDKDKVIVEQGNRVSFVAVLFRVELSHEIELLSSVGVY